MPAAPRQAPRGHLLSPAFSGPERLRAGVPGPVWALAAVLGAVAYRSLLLGGPRPAASSGFEQWFFTPGQTSALLPLVIGAWMLARRCARLRALPDRSAPGLVLALLATGLALFAWARLGGEESLLLPSLSANLLALAAAARGRSGAAAVLLPALVLLLGAPMPAPLRDELVWRLQNLSAQGATAILELAGAEVFLGGVQIHSGRHAFTVIETCSGLRGIEILTLLALAVRELFARRGPRSWLVVLIAPGLGLALNLLRIAAVVALTAGADDGASPTELASSWDHTPQGIAVLLVGTALLYGLGRALAGPEKGAPPRPAPREDGGPSVPARRRAVAAAVLTASGALAILSIAVAPLPGPELPPPIEMPIERAGWRGEDLEPDRAFVGQFQPGQVLLRRYRGEPASGPPRVVDLMVAYEAVENPSSRLLSPKLLVPDHDWSLADARAVRLWLLGLDGQLAIAARASEQVLVYLWRVRDEGLWRETLRAALGLGVGPYRRERRRVVVRVETPLAGEGSMARGQAKRTLDRFVADFRDELSRL